MKRTDLLFLVFGIGAIAEIVVLVLAILLHVHTIALLYLLGAGALVALVSFGAFIVESVAEMHSASYSH